ncbi:MAG: hypothetical protein Q4P30_05245 [Eubacteriales bacterium]|nr:hypothetical protein [Eubacteriales bacterium]
MPGRLPEIPGIVDRQVGEGICRKENLTEACTATLHGQNFVRFLLMRLLVKAFDILFLTVFTL